MDPTTLIASLLEAVPGAELEPASTIDLQTTVYAPRDRLVPLATGRVSRADR